MTLAAYDKRIRFNALACNAGHECLTANDWYCALSRKVRMETPNAELVERFTNEVLGLDPAAPVAADPLPGFSAEVK